MNRVIHFEIQADDIERAKKFYANVLGWKIDKMTTKGEKGSLEDYWGVTTGESSPGINGGLYERPKEGEKMDKVYFYDCTVEVSDLDKALAAVKDNGGLIMKDKMEITGIGWFARAKDTEGNRFGLIQPTGWQPK